MIIVTGGIGFIGSCIVAKLDEMNNSSNQHGGYFHHY